MDDTYINFIKDAYNSGLCEGYKNEVRKCNRNAEALSRLAMRQQSIPWVATKIKEGVIPVNYAKRKFAGLINGKTLKDCDNVAGYTYQWYIDHNKDIFTSADVINITACKNIDITIKQTKCPVIYINNNSNVNINLEGYNSIKIYLFDNSHAAINDTDNESDVTIYKYSTTCNATENKFCLCKVKQFNKTLRL